MKGFISLGEAAQLLAQSLGTEDAECWQALLENSAEELKAVTQWVEHRGAVPGGVSYLRPPEEWRIPLPAFNTWRRTNGFTSAPAPEAQPPGRPAAPGELPQGDAQGGRRRTDNLKRAIFDALDHLPGRPSAQQVFDYLATKDETGYIRSRNGDELSWENGSGETSQTTLKAIANRLPAYFTERNETP